MPAGAPTPFISLQEPSPLKEWDRSKSAAAQDQSAIPRTFLDAMEVRGSVFVEEQGVPWAYEFDEDDPRSCHWVVYASVHRVLEPERRDEATGALLSPRRSETRSQPIGTVRLVPFPHEPHPLDGGVYVDNKLTNAADLAGPGGPADSSGDVKEAKRLSVLRFEEDRATDLHDGKELYVKLGRLAVVKEFRGQGIAPLLVRTALDWMRKHPSYFDPGASALGVEQLGMDRGIDVPKWNGLVCCHAQETVVKTWEKCGFVEDKAMGRWMEEGIPHVGMFVRLETIPESAMP